MRTQTQKMKNKAKAEALRSSRYSTPQYPHPVLKLQQQIGNQAVQRLLQPRHIQAKLTIGQPNDKYEQEADRVADQVMRMPESKIQREINEFDEDEMEQEEIQTKPLGATITPVVQRQLTDEIEEEEEELLQAKEMPGQSPEVSNKLEGTIHSLLGGGQPLSSLVRDYMEPRFGYNFNQVRVHTDTQAAKVARSINARAFTLGQDVVFGSGHYSPSTARGKHLLAHELAHVIQQEGSLSTNKFIQKGDEPDATTGKKKPDESEEEKSEKEKGREVKRETIWIGVIDDASAWIRIKAEDGKYPELYQGATTKEKTTQLDPEKDFAPLEKKIAVATKVKWFMKPGKEEIARITWNDKQAWVHTAKLKGNRIKIKNGDPVTLMEPGSKRKYIEVIWKEQRVWTARSNLARTRSEFDLKYTTDVNSEELKKVILHPAKGSKPYNFKSRNAYRNGAPDAYIDANQLKGFLTVAVINNGLAYARVKNDETGAWDKTEDEKKIDNGKQIIIIEEQKFEEKSGKKKKTVNYAKCKDFAGNEYWTWAGNEPRTDKHGNFTFKTMNPIVLQEITDKSVHEILEKQYSDALEKLLKSKKGFLENQRDLMAKAKKFEKSAAEQAKVPNQVPYKASQLKIEDRELNSDLRHRLDVFYKFLVANQLVSELLPSVSTAVRGKKEAHKYSTVYSIVKDRIGLEDVTKLGFKEEDGKKIYKDKSGLIWYVEPDDKVTKKIPAAKPEEKIVGEKEKGGKEVAKMIEVLDEAATWEKIKLRAKTYWAHPNSAAEGYSDAAWRAPNNVRYLSNHLQGNAVDVVFKFMFNYFEPIIDALAAIFGLVRSDRASGEYWHYERVGVVSPGKDDETGEED